MKKWDANHPKAKLMARKRADILAAAKHCFLEMGYEGTSMEGIAKAAGVSIMTLYRHADGKDDVFSAVISNFCTLSDDARQADMEARMRKPLREILVETGMFGQESLMLPDTVALLRTVMAEAKRFPHLAEMAYSCLIDRLMSIVVYVLDGKPEASRLNNDEKRRLAGYFIDRLIGSDMLRSLLGLPGLDEAGQEYRARQVTEELMLQIADLQ